MHNNSGVNKVFLIGNIETAPKHHQNAQGRSRLAFSLTTVEDIRNGKQPFEHTEVHYLVIDADHTDIERVELLKGDRLFIIGKVQRMWIDTDNIKRYKTEIYVSQLTLL